MLNNVKYLFTTHDINLMPQDDIPEVVIVGRSNVGKSSFINAITNKKRLAYISSKPGKTKAISFFQVENKFRIVDIPGYGFAKVSDKQKIMFSEMIDKFLHERHNIKQILILLDSRIGVTDDDLLIIDFLNQVHIKYKFLGTKSDKLNQSQKHFFKVKTKELLDQEVPLYSNKDSKSIEKAINLLKSMV